MAKYRIPAEIVLEKDITVEAENAEEALRLFDLQLEPLAQSIAAGLTEEESFDNVEYRYEVADLEEVDDEEEDE